MEVQIYIRQCNGCSASFMTQLENEWGNTSEDTGEVSVEAESEEFQISVTAEDMFVDDED